MASKKYSFLAGALCLLVSHGFSQNTGTTGTSGTTGSNGTYDVSDSSVVPSRRMPQHTEFMNGTYNFPAKPRNQWEIGVKGGSFAVGGDVTSRLSPGFGVHIRKALGYVFSMRLEYMYGIGKGLNWKPSTNYYNNPAWTANGYTPGATPVYYNYKNNTQDLALEGLITLNNIRFHKAKTGFSVYALFGAGATIYDVKVDALNSSGQPYNFSSISGGVYKDRKSTIKALKAMMDGNYETPADSYGNQRGTLFNKSFQPVAHVGAGMAFRLGRVVNLAIEDRFSITKSDLLDGQRWAEQVPGQPVLTGDYDTYNYLTVGLNFNIGSKSVEPLWWQNPLDYAYSEIRNPRLMRLPKPVLPDADGDGVTDQFDQEPNTPAGCPVDTHGVSRDTDGDGVPDCRDKELVTPTYCQPVDADGVGKCPCPQGCGTPVDSANACVNKLGALPSVTFTGNAHTISNDAKSLLTTIASRMRNNPDCKVVVTGYCASNKQQQQRSWDRVNAIINYMVEKEGISADRFVFVYGQEGGDCNTVDLRGATPTDQSNNAVPAPHPNLSGKK